MESFRTRSENDGTTFSTPMTATCSSGIVCFEVAGMKPDAVVARLKELRVVASASPYIPSYVRLTPGLTNTPEEVDRAVAAVKAIAGRAESAPRVSGP